MDTNQKRFTFFSFYLENVKCFCRNVNNNLKWKKHQQQKQICLLGHNELHGIP